MTEFREVQVGDRVTVVHENGDTATFTVTKGVLGSDSLFNAGGMCILSQYWTITDLDRPEPKVELPTEPGWYLGSDELNGNPSFPMLIATDGSIHYPDATRAGGFSVLGDPERFAPFTKLEPVRVTTKEVLAAVKADIVLGAMDEDSYSHVMACVEHVGQQFGVAD